MSEQHIQVSVEIYLRDRIIVGRLDAGRDRPLDRLNDQDSSWVTLEDARLRHPLTDDEIAAGSVRVDKGGILLVVPQPLPASRLLESRHRWVAKRQVRVEIGVGPLSVTGYLHLQLATRITLDDIFCGIDGHAFVPVTVARVSSMHRPGWSLEVPTTLIATRSLSDICLPSELPAADQESFLIARKA